MINIMIELIHIFRNKKEVTYCDHIDFPLTSWSDLSNWPQLEVLSKQGANIIGVNMEKKVVKLNLLFKYPYDSHEVTTL